MAANHFIRHFIQPPNFHNTDYWAALTYINICTGRFLYGSIHAKKKRYVGEKHFKIHHETTQKQDRYTFFLNQESIVLKDAMGTLRPSHYRADE